jgi:pilus assembly protein CpaC
MYTQSFRRFLAPLASLCLLPLAVWAEESAAPSAPAAPPTVSPTAVLAQPPIEFKVQSPTEQLEMVVHTSRILALDKKIVQTQPGNPDMLDMTVLSPNQIQITAKATGVTQVSLWDENRTLYTVNILVSNDARELTMLLRTTFPHCALKVTPVAGSVLISGYVDKNEHIARIIRIAEEFYPGNNKVINNMTVGGVQQVRLHVKLMEVSRTKLRQCGFDWAKITGTNAVISGPSGLLSDYNTGIIPPGSVFRTASPATFAFRIADGANAFYGVLEALRQDNFMSILSEPVLTSVNGERSDFNVGGQMPVPEPQSLGTTSIQWKDFGTRVKFIPIVLGNGRISLDVYAEVSETDYGDVVVISNNSIPTIKTRNVHVHAEMMAGQTLPVAGLLQVRTEASNAGLPGLSDIPYLGMLFREVMHKENEVELLILVTPELVEAMDADQVPPGGPGTATTSPGDWALYMKGQLEVPVPPPCDVCDCRPGAPQSPEAVPAEPGVPQSAGSHNRYARVKPTSSTVPSAPETPNGPPGFIGPIGYDVGR